jgi:hypothetical protein
MSVFGHAHRLVKRDERLNSRQLNDTYLTPRPEVLRGDVSSALGAETRVDKLQGIDVYLEPRLGRIKHCLSSAERAQRYPRALTERP